MSSSSPHANCAGPRSAGKCGHSRLARGFSLVEVTLTIGILSFGLISILGLFPVGLRTLHQAADQVTEGQIAQRLGGEMLLTPFTQLETKYAQETYFYSEDGDLLGDADGARYRATFSLADPVYPGTSEVPASTVVESLRTMQVEIVRLQGEPATNRFSIQIPNSGNSQ